MNDIITVQFLAACRDITSVENDYIVFTPTTDFEKRLVLDLVTQKTAYEITETSPTKIKTDIPASLLDQASLVDDLEFE